MPCGESDHPLLLSAQNVFLISLTVFQRGKTYGQFLEGKFSFLPITDSTLRRNVPSNQRNVSMCDSLYYLIKASHSFYYTLVS